MRLRGGGLKPVIKNVEGGLTLVEVLIAFVILATTFLTVMGIFAQSARRNVDAGKHQAALALAQSKLEELKNTAYNSVPEVSTPVQFSLESNYSCYNGFTYTISVDGSSHDGLNKTVTVTVFYSDGDVTKHVALTTDYTKR